RGGTDSRRSERGGRSRAPQSAGRRFRGSAQIVSWKNASAGDRRDAEMPYNQGTPERTLWPNEPVWFVVTRCLLSEEDGQLWRPVLAAGVGLSKRAYVRKPDAGGGNITVRG